MKKTWFLLSFVTMFGCTNRTDAPITQEEAQVIPDTAVVDSIQEVQKKVFRKPSVEYIYPIQARSTSYYPVEGEDTLVADVGDYFYSVAPTGEIREESTKDKSIKTFKLKTQDLVESAYFYFMGDKLLVYYTDTDREGAASFAELIDRKTGKTVYSASIEGFNLGKPIIIGDKSYVSAIGFVGKLDLAKGKYDWKHNGLYDTQKYSFNSFDSVIVDVDTVKFISNNYHSKAIDIVIVANKTGKLVNVIK